MFLYDAVVHAMPFMVSAFDAGVYTPEFREFMRTYFPSPFTRRDNA